MSSPLSPQASEPQGTGSAGGTGEGRDDEWRDPFEHARQPNGSPGCDHGTVAPTPTQTEDSEAARDAGQVDRSRDERDRRSRPLALAGSEAARCGPTSTIWRPTWDERTGAPGADHLAPLAMAVTKIDRRPERALDIGTGTGVAALFVAREFPHASVRGVDVSEEMIRKAKAKVGLDPEGRVAFRVADASSLPFDDAGVRPRDAAQHAAVLRRDRTRPSPRRPRHRRRELRGPDALLHARLRARARLHAPRHDDGQSRIGSAAAPTSSPARGTER